MKDTEYTFAVARIRANETHFIGKNEMEQLLLAPDLRAALQLFGGSGLGNTGRAGGSKRDAARAGSTDVELAHRGGSGCGRAFVPDGKE